jgi:hypothetical protein
MAELRNTLPGYEVENANVIPDDEDTGLGIAAGDTVTITDDHDVYPDEQGVVQAVVRDRATGMLMVDVLIDDTSDAERFGTGDIAEVGA